VTDPEAFAAEWIDAWNSHDLPRILSHYAPEIAFTSPASTRFTGDPTGRIDGKAALEAYWSRALAAAPDLTFTLRAVLKGPRSIAVRYESSRTGGEVVEVLRFGDAGLVVEAAAYYE
jgi:hypothetical protein